MARVAIVTDSSADLAARRRWLDAGASARSPSSSASVTESFTGRRRAHERGLLRPTDRAGRSLPADRRAVDRPRSRTPTATPGRRAPNRSSASCCPASSRRRCRTRPPRRPPSPTSDVRIVDSQTTSHQLGLLVRAAAEMAADGADADAIVEHLADLRDRSRLYIASTPSSTSSAAGGSSAAQAAIGSVLSVKPIITIEDGVVETVDRPRTSSRARARLLELLALEPVERAVVLHTSSPRRGSLRRRSWPSGSGCRATASRSASSGPWLAPTSVPGPSGRRSSAGPLSPSADRRQLVRSAGAGRSRRPRGVHSRRLEANASEPTHAARPGVRSRPSSERRAPDGMTTGEGRARRRCVAGRAAPVRHRRRPPRPRRRAFAPSSASRAASSS